MVLFLSLPFLLPDRRSLLSLVTQGPGFACKLRTSIHPSDIPALHQILELDSFKSYITWFLLAIIALLTSQPPNFDNCKYLQVQFSISAVRHQLLTTTNETSCHCVHDWLLEHWSCFFIMDWLCIDTTPFLYRSYIKVPIVGDILIWNRFNVCFSIIYITTHITIQVTTRVPRVVQLVLWSSQCVVQVSRKPI